LFGLSRNFFWGSTREKGAVPTHSKVLNPVKLPQEKIGSRNKDSAAQFEIDTLQELGKDNKSFFRNSAISLKNFRERKVRAKCLHRDAINASRTPASRAILK
jgi:hypothetical protein